MLICKQKLYTFKIKNKMSRFPQYIICNLMILAFQHGKLLALPDGLHPTPPMGWSSWNTFFGPRDEETLMAQVNVRHLM